MFFFVILNRLCASDLFRSLAAALILICQRSERCGSLLNRTCVAPVYERTYFKISRELVCLAGDKAITG